MDAEPEEERVVDSPDGLRAIAIATAPVEPVGGWVFRFRERSVE